MSYYYITIDNFDKEVMQSDRTVLVDFNAPWCGPCRMLEPILEEIAEERKDVKVCKINVDEERALAEAFQVSAIPMILVIKEGKIVANEVGYMGKADILKIIDRA